MRQKITLICSQATILLLVMLLTSVSAWAGSGDTYVVDANGGGQYTSISAAVNAATGGETISIKNGEYTETSRINIGSKRLSFIGESQDGVIIRSGNNDLFYTQDNGYSSIFISRMTFKDISMTGARVPIQIGGNGNVTIDHCTFDNCASFCGAMFINTYGTVTIDNCTLLNTKSSIGSYSSAIHFGSISTSNYTIRNTVIDGSSISDANTEKFIWGVIYNEKTDGTVTLDNVTIRNCNLDKAFGLIATKGNMTIKNSTIVNNDVYGNDQNAGFIYIYNNKTVTIETSMILNNRRPNNFLTSNDQFASFNLNYNNIQGNTFNTAFTKSGNTYTLDANYWGSNTKPDYVTASTWVVKNSQGNYELNNEDALPAGKSIPECSHSSLTAHPAVAATCLDNGNSAYWQCNTCGKYFSDNQGTTEIAANSWVIPATGHTLINHPAIAATCTDAGINEYWECSNCHKYFSDGYGTNEIIADSWVIAATGHNFVNDECNNCHLVRIPYLDASGNTQYCLDYTVLDNTMNNLTAGWYVVNDDITYTSGITLSGNVHIILTDGKTMNIGTSANRISDVGINNGSSLTIYGQSTDATTMGTLSIYTTVKNKYAINTGVITINGGRVTANTNGVLAYALRCTSTNINGGIVSVTATDNGAFAIYTQGNTVITGGTVEATSTKASAIYARDNGNVTISGGNVIARAGGNAIAGNNLTISGGNVEATTTSGTTFAIHSRGNLALGWSNVTDCIKASNYYSSGTFTIASGKTFYDGTGASYSGSLTAEQINALAGKTLRTFNYGGTCGDVNVNEGKNVTWIRSDEDNNGSLETLTISGTGPMMYYGSALGSDNKYHSTAPWSYLDSEIQKVIVGDGVTYIGSYAFAYCTALTSVSLPASVAALGDYVCYTSNVTRIDIPSTTAATIGTGGFDCCPADLQIAVPSTLLGTYQTATNWSTYEDNLVGVLSETTGFGTTFATGNYEYKRTFKCGVASTVCLPFSVTAAQTTPVGKFYSFAGIDKSGEKWEVIMEEATNKVTTDLTANTPYLFMPYIVEGKSKGDAVECTFSGTVSSAGDAGYSGWIESGTDNEWAFQGVYYNYAWNDGNANLDKVYGFAAQSYDAPDNDQDGNPDYTVSPGDFVKAAAGANIAPFRAFLQCNAVTNAPRRSSEVLPSRMMVRLVNADGSTTSLSEKVMVNSEKMATASEWYTLDGRKLDKQSTKKGLYIHNGHKVVIK